jgi:hypothetical protein
MTEGNSQIARARAVMIPIFLPAIIFGSLQLVGCDELGGGAPANPSPIPVSDPGEDFEDEENEKEKPAARILFNRPLKNAAAILFDDEFIQTCDEYQNHHARARIDLFDVSTSKMEANESILVGVVDCKSQEILAEQRVLFNVPGEFDPDAKNAKIWRASVKLLPNEQSPEPSSEPTAEGPPQGVPTTVWVVSSDKTEYCDDRKPVRLSTPVRRLEGIGIKVYQAQHGRLDLSFPEVCGGSTGGVNALLIAEDKLERVLKIDQFKLPAGPIIFNESNVTNP